MTLIGQTNKTNPMQRELKQVRALLISITARIMQISDRKASVALGAATNALLGAGFAAAVTGMVGTYGVAQTGTAIAGLYGAAKASATMYWIGGLVGGGVAAGTLVLGAGALGVGIYGSIKVRQAIMGLSRRKENLTDSELRIIEVVRILVMAIDATTESEFPAGQKELGLFARVGLRPLLDEVNAALRSHVFDDLTTYQRARLRGHVINLRKLEKRLSGS